MKAQNVAWIVFLSAIVGALAISANLGPMETMVLGAMVGTAFSHARSMKTPRP